VRGVRAVDHIHGADVAGKLLIDPLKQPLRSRALDLMGDVEQTRWLVSGGAGRSSGAQEAFPQMDEPPYLDINDAI